MPDKAGRRDAEQGFMLLGLIVAIAIIMLFLGVAASEMAHTVRREREVESARRANQYVRAIRLFYLKNGGRYPGSVKQLENTNTIRFLRQQYVDPLTGKADYRLIAVGQNKTQVKGFFGQPLGGIASAGLGSAAGMQSSGLSIALGGAGTVGTSAADGAAGAAGAPERGGGDGGWVGNGGQPVFDFFLWNVVGDRLARIDGTHYGRRQQRQGRFHPGGERTDDLPNVGVSV